MAKLNIPQIKSKTSPSINKVKNFIKRGYIWVLVAYLILCISYWYFFIHYKGQTCDYLDSHFDVGFYTSFSASLLDDIVVFFILGIIGAIIPILVSRTPAEEDFNTRVKALMNGEHVQENDKLVSYLKQYLSTFLAYISDLQIKIMVKDYNEEQNAYKIFTEYDIVMSNMCRDSEYHIKDPTIKIIPDVCVNGELGYISYLGTYDPETLEPIETLIDDDKKESHVKLDGTYIRDLAYKIPKNGKVAWKLRFTIWSKIYDNYDDPASWFSHSFARYGQNMKIILENHLNSEHNVTFDVKKFDSKIGLRSPVVNKGILVHNSDGPQKLKVDPEYHPGDIIEFYFYKFN